MVQMERELGRVQPSQGFRRRAVQWQALKEGSCLSKAGMRKPEPRRAVSVPELGADQMAVVPLLSPI